jgi:hypothetical protein
MMKESFKKREVMRPAHGGGGWNSRDDAILFNSLLIEAGGGW